ncbi:MAG: glutamate--tRNA ligase [Firmicutes bacterium]|jgi:nondiscriminating glutamyl-tRNA synthetase|nr:glutamate--tRNA ligase [Bacillota bacterium]
MSVRVRFAPSPTGYVHIGSLRTALYNYLFAKGNENGKYILRIEDTDRTRLVEGAVENMLEAMEWAGVNHDEGPVLLDGQISETGDFGPYVQSDRLEIYKKHIETLLEKGHAYYCFCTKERLDQVREQQKANGETPKYDGHCRDIDLEEARKRAAAGESYVIRLKLPVNRDIMFDDVVRGKVVVNTNDVDDQVLIKTDGFPTYHFAVIVDDHHMGITHVIRGEEWLPSTPKHVYMYEAFGWDAPRYVHLPNILNSEKKKLSKRHGDVAVKDFKEKGYLPEALVNYISLLGWSPEDNSEIMSIEEIISKFSLERVSKSGGVFDVEKLNWINSHYLKEADLDRLTELASRYFVEGGYVSEDEIKDKWDWMKSIISATREKLDYLKQVVDYIPLFLGETVDMEDENAKEMVELDHVPDMLEVFKGKILESEELTKDSTKKILKAVQKETGHKGKNLFMPVRVAVSGQCHGPDLNEMLVILGKDLISKRIDFVKNNYCK